MKVLAVVLASIAIGSASAQNLTPNGYTLPSPLTGNETVDCQLPPTDPPTSPYFTTCTTAQIAALGTTGHLTVGTTPILGTSCPNGYLLYNNAGILGCTPGSVISLTNAGAPTAIPGSSVYVSGAGAFRLAVANGYSTAGVIGLSTASITSTISGPIAVNGPLTLTTLQWDAVVTGESGGLSIGALYFLDPSAPGNLTTTPPTTPGQLVTVIGRGISATQMLLMIGPPIQL